MRTTYPDGMTIDELIAKLEALQAEYGIKGTTTLEVVASDSCVILKGADGLAFTLATSCYVL